MGVIQSDELTLEDLRRISVHMKKHRMKPVSGFRLWRIYGWRWAVANRVPPWPWQGWYVYGRREGQWELIRAR